MAPAIGRAGLAMGDIFALSQAVSDVISPSIMRQRAFAGRASPNLAKLMRDESRIILSLPVGSTLPQDIEPVGSGKAPAQAIPGTLYIVSTPIGNLRDISLRALDILGSVDLIACEDTRVSAKLMQAYRLKAPLVPYHDHNAAEMRPKLLQKLRDGLALALISDAGTPLISDPGYKLVQDCLVAGLPTTAIPGASAPLMALCLSGLPSDRFMFAGFLSAKAAARKAELRNLAAIPATLIFFESPGRLAATLAAMAEMLGNRQAAVARELTKKFEEVKRGKLTDLQAWALTSDTIRGEFVVLVGPPEEGGASEDDLDNLLRNALAEHSLKAAVAAVTAKTGHPRKLVYARALALQVSQ
jgi:16S rRNA (cytidine1402-2'-O)-methyltransferase